jgi:hypothetical protein
MALNYTIPSCELGYYAGIMNTTNITPNTQLECLQCSSHFARCANVIFENDYDCRSSYFTTAAFGKIVGLSSCFEPFDESVTCTNLAIVGGFVFLIYLLASIFGRHHHYTSQNIVHTFVMPIIYLMATSATFVLKYIIVGLNSSYEPIYSDYGTNICVAISMICYGVFGLVCVLSYLKCSCDTDRYVGRTSILNAVTAIRILPFLCTIITSVLLTLLYCNVYAVAINNVSLPDIDAYGFKTDGVVNLSFNLKFKIWILVNLGTSYFAFLIQLAYMVYLFLQKREIDNNNRIMNNYNSIADQV